MTPSLPLTNPIPARTSSRRSARGAHRGLTEAVGDEEAVAAMLSQFPAGDDRLATEQFVRTELADQLAGQERRLEEKFATKDFVRAEVSGLETRMEQRFTDLETRMVKGFSDVMEHVHQEMRHYVLWSYGAIFLLVTGVLTVAKILQ
jgi:hypothetical protein